MRTLIVALLLPLAVVSVAPAAEVQPATVPVAVISFPATLAGVPLDAGAPDGSRARYMTKGTAYDQSPVINLIAGPLTKEVPINNTRLAMREVGKTWGLRSIVKEQSFLSSLAPDKTGLAAEYITGAGIIQTWTIRTDKKGYIVLALVHKEADRQRVWNAVSDDIFHAVGYAELPKDSPK